MHKEHIECLTLVTPFFCQSSITDVLATHVQAHVCQGNIRKDCEHVPCSEKSGNLEIPENFTLKYENYLKISGKNQGI